MTNYLNKFVKVFKSNTNETNMNSTENINKSSNKTALNIIKDTISNTANSILINSNIAYSNIYKTNNSNLIYSDHEITELLKSKMNIEVIFALRHLVILTQQGSSILKYLFLIIQILTTNKNVNINKLCLFLIEYCSVDINNSNDKETGELLMLTSNYIDKKLNKDYQDIIIRITCLHLTAILNNNIIYKNLFDNICKCINDCNPYLKRIAIICISKYNVASLMDDTQYEIFLNKIMNDPHPLVFTTAVYYLVQSNNRDYFSYKLPLLFNKIIDLIDCSKYNNNYNRESFYFENLLFYLTNFSLYFLVNIKENNNSYLKRFINCLFSNLNSCDSNVDFACLSSINVLYNKLFNIKNINDSNNNNNNNNNINNINNYKNLVDLLINNNNITTICNIIVLNINYNNDNKVLSYMFYSLLFDFVNTLKLNTDIYNIFLQEITNNLSIIKINYKDEDYIVNAKLNIISNICNENIISKTLTNLRTITSLPSKSKNVINNTNIKLRILSKLYIIITSNTSNKKVKSLIIKFLIDSLNSKDINVLYATINYIKEISCSFKDYNEIIIINLISIINKLLSSIEQNNNNLNIAIANILSILSSFIDLKPTLLLDVIKNVINKEIDSDDVKLQSMYFCFKLYYYTNYKNIYINEDNKIIANKISLYYIKNLLHDNNFSLREKAKFFMFYIELNMLNNLNFDIDMQLLNNNNNNTLDNSNMKYLSYRGAISNILNDNNINYNCYVYQKDSINDLEDENLRNLDMKTLISSINSCAIEDNAIASNNASNYSKVKYDDSSTIKNDAISYQNYSKNFDDYKKELEDKMNFLINEDLDNEIDNTNTIKKTSNIDNVEDEEECAEIVYD